MASIINIPEDLADELDRLEAAEHQERASFAVGLLWREVRRRRQLEALKNTKADWRF